MLFGRRKKTQDSVATPSEDKPLATQDSTINPVTPYAPIASGTVEWFQSQSFLGWTICEKMAEHWLISAACEIPIQDAIRKGWSVSVNDEITLSKKDEKVMKTLNKKSDFKKSLLNFGVFGRVFGVRVAVFLIKGYTAKDYAAPFNPDGVKKGSYQGCIMPDPQFIAPIVNDNDPASTAFYEPEYWLVSGVKYHKSHCVVYHHSDSVGQQTRPLYMYGGVSLPQQIHEQVYEAVTCLNESSKLLMTKRLWVQNGDIVSMIANQCETESRLNFITRTRDNHGVQLIDSEDAITQLETALAGVGEVIDQQLQVVAAIARIPVNKLLQNQLKGFGSTGEAEADIYTAALEVIHDKLQPLVERHVLLTALDAGCKVDFDVNFESPDTITAIEKIEISRAKSEIDLQYIAAGVLTAMEVRGKLIKDKESGYSELELEIDEGYDHDIDEDGNNINDDLMSFKP